MRRRSVDAKLARNVLVGDLKELFLITVSIIRILPETPKQNIRLKQKKFQPLQIIVYLHMGQIHQSGNLP